MQNCVISLFMMFLDDSFPLLSSITFIVFFFPKVYIITLGESEALACMFEEKNPIKTAVKHVYDFIDQ
jgi:hypothetical protein